MTHRRTPRQSQKQYTAAERDDLILQLRREQTQLLDALVQAQSAVERVKAEYQRVQARIAELKDTPVFGQECDRQAHLRRSS